LSYLGMARALGGDPAGGRELVERGLATYHQLGAPRGEGLARRELALIALMSGDLALAEREARAAIELFDVAPPLRAGALATLAQALLTAGRTDEALAHAREAKQLLDTLGTIDQGESQVRLVYAEALAAAGLLEEAAAAIRAARERLEARAARIHDGARRARFLTRIPDHARTLDLARAWGA